MLPKIEEITDAVSSSRITAEQLNRLIQSVYILPEKRQGRDSFMLYADMAGLSDITPPH
jgi:hypothetical protein